MDEGEPWTTKDFKYRWMPVDCAMKAPFICKYNPGTGPFYYHETCIIGNIMLQCK